MIVLIIGLLLSIFLIICSTTGKDTAGTILGVIFSVSFIITGSLGDYLTTVWKEVNIKIQYENLSKEGAVIEGFSGSILIKTDNSIQLENMNQASYFIQSKMEWIDLVKKHNKEILTIRWRHENKWLYFVYGLTPFKSAEDAEKYLIEIK